MVIPPIAITCLMMIDDFMLFLIILVIAIYAFIGVYKLIGIEIDCLGCDGTPIRNTLVFIIFWPFIKVG